MQAERTVYVVDDDGVVLRSVALLLGLSGYTVMTFQSGTAFLSQVAAAEPGCVLLDVGMPELTGLDVLKRLKVYGPRFATVMFTGRGDVALAVEAMKWGAMDFIEKPYGHEVLLRAVRETFERIDSFAAGERTAEDARLRISLLSMREREVLQRLLSGWPNKVIAYQLGLSTRTVEMYRANVMDKLQARGLPMAVRLGLAAGLEPVDEPTAHRPH